jgi:predicted dienelactone hydrolase
MPDFVGLREVELCDERTGVGSPMVIFYPTAVCATTERLGRSDVTAARDGAPTAGAFPLVLVSHGSGGSHLAYRTLAVHLAANGFVVGMPEHPFNNRVDNALEGTLENLAARPKHLTTAIDWLYGSTAFAPVLAPNRVAIVGHSMGGYTALAAAGGVPTSLAHESADWRAKPVNVVRDRRIKALVLLAPATIWFRGAGALDAVDAPILMLLAERDVYVPPIHAQILLNGIADKSQIAHRVVPNAGHFSFLSPFPTEMTNPSFVPSQDPAGFDRERFHDELNAEILAFLTRTL